MHDLVILSSMSSLAKQAYQGERPWLKAQSRSINEAVLAKDESGRRAAQCDATAAYENAKALLNRSPCSQSQVFGNGSGSSNQREHEDVRIQAMTAKLQSKNDECPLCESNAIYENSADDLTRRVYECPK